MEILLIFPPALAAALLIHAATRWIIRIGPRKPRPSQSPRLRAATIRLTGIDAAARELRVPLIDFEPTFKLTIGVGAGLGNDDGIWRRMLDEDRSHA